VFDGLLLSRDDAIIRLFRRMYQELEMDLEVCTGAEQAMEHLSQRRFSAVIVDCDDTHRGPQVLQSVRGNVANRRATAFAILNGVTSMRGAFDLGANMTLQKPVSLEHVRKSLRVLKNILEQEHRRYHRVVVDFPVTLIFDEKQEFQTMAINLSDGGMALRHGHPIPEHRTASVRFALPGSTSRLEVKVSVAWHDSSSSAGLRFEYMPPGARQELNAWLFRNMELPKKPAASNGRRLSQPAR
jgi:ActR/RegA family two-component response regulator